MRVNFFYRLRSFFLLIEMLCFFSEGIDFEDLEELADWEAAEGDYGAYWFSNNWNKLKSSSEHCELACCNFLSFSILYLTSISSSMAS